MNARISLNIWLVLSALLLGMAGTAVGRTIFVDANAPGANDGSSWVDAYKYLQDALADAKSNGDVNEILVAQGMYRPDCNSADPNGSGDRTATFQLINGIAIKGGYAGSGEPDPNARDIGEYETILNGDLAGNDGPGEWENNDENSYHVVIGSGTDANAILDGFTVTAGNADGPDDPSRSGGGMYNYYASPTVTNCTFSGNLALGGAYDSDSGGMYNHSGSPTVVNCTFNENSGWNGGGMYNVYCSTGPKLTNCTFTSNSASSWGGGGMDNYYSNPTLTNQLYLQRKLSLVRWRDTPTLRQPDADQLYLQRQLCQRWGRNTSGRGQPDADQLYLQWQLCQLRGRDVKLLERLNPEQLHLQR